MSKHRRKCARVVLKANEERWKSCAARVGFLSRVEWKTRGARAALIRRAFEIFAEEGCHYIVLNGGLTNGKYLKYLIEKELAGMSAKDRAKARPNVEKRVLRELTAELNSVIPSIERPPEVVRGSKYVRIYVSTSPIIDGALGQEFAKVFLKKRPDIVLLKEGHDYTRLKGVGNTPEERKEGQLIGLLNPRKHRLPGQYASNALDKEISEEEAAADDFPAAWVFGGTATSVSKPGSGERHIPAISLPVLHIPTPGRVGEPSIALNQIGLRILESAADGRKTVITWSLRDLTKSERTFITGIKSDAKLIHQQIAEAIKQDRHGLTVGEIADKLEIPREEVQEAIRFLVEPRALKRVTWPGLYLDEESGRYNFHRDWLQSQLSYPWPYGEEYTELRRLLFGCMHAGYTTTDYEYMRWRLPEIIIEKDIHVLEVIGDLVAGLKHGLMHRGQIIGNMNYTDQEQFGGELVGTVIYAVFENRLKAKIKDFSDEKLKSLSAEDVGKLVSDSLLLLLYIVGNHDGWQKDLGVTPGDKFGSSVIDVVYHHIRKLLTEMGVCLPNLYELVLEKIKELPENDAVFTFPNGLSTELIHPSMSRTKTVSIRCEEALNFSRCTIVDIANFHTAIEVEKYHADLGERVATQVGTMVIDTDFERGKLKRLDFGPVFVGIRHKQGRVFRVEHIFFNDPILKKPIPRSTDIESLKDRLKLCRVSS